MVSLFATTGALYGISYGVSAFRAKKESKSSVEMSHGKVFERFSHALAYVIGVLLSQSILIRLKIIQNIQHFLTIC